jgi:hypothetical protein
MKIKIIDPVCGLKTGHNYSTILKYEDWLMKNFKEIESLDIFVPNILDVDGKKLNLNKTLPWMYEYYLKQEKVGLFILIQRFVYKLQIANRYGLLLKLLFSPFQIILRLVLHYYCIYTLRNRLNKIIHTDGILFFPGVDYYSIKAIESILNNSKTSLNIKIIMRFMGVMESMSYLPFGSKDYLYSLRKIISLGCDIRITAETEKMAHYLSRNLEVSVSVTGIPAAKKSAYINSKNTKLNILRIGVLGGARADKGFFELNEISKIIESKLMKRFKIITQTMSSKNKEFDAQYELVLRKNKNIELLPSYLDDTELEDLMNEVDIILLPYSPGTYQMRGSAILFDNIEHRKFVLAKAGTAFADTVLINGLGAVYSDYDELVEKLIKFTEMDNHSKSIINLNQSNYGGLLNESLMEVFNA